MVSKLVVTAAVIVFACSAVPALAAVDAAATCADKKAKAAGKKAADILKALGKNVKKPNGAKLALDVSKAQSKFTKGFTKAEAKGGCWTVGDSGPMENKVDAFVDEIVGRIDPPPCGTAAAPECFGLCDPGESCALEFNGTEQICVCAPGNIPCGLGVSQFECDGACPSGFSCAPSGPICQCLFNGPLCGGVPVCLGPCNDPEAPICRDIGGSCACTP